MSDVISRFERVIRRINLLYGLLIPIVIGIVMGRTLNYLNPGFFRNDPAASTVYMALNVLGVIALFVHLKGGEKLARWSHAFLYIFYCLGLSLLVIFLDPYPTPFYFQFILLLIAVDLIFGEWWFRFTLVYFASVFYLSYFNSTDDITAEGIALATTYVIGSTLVAVLVSRYRRVSDEERELLDKTSKESAFERQRLLSLINNMGEAVVATDAEGKIIIYNAAVLELLDTNQTLDNKSLDNILKLKDKAGKIVKPTSLLQHAKTGTTNTDLMHEFGPGDHMNIYINIASIKLGFKDETGTGFIIIMRDITKEKSLEEERDEFISVVSHELRTPVAIAEGNISNAVFATGKKADKKVIKSALNEAHDQVVFLSNMINDLATLSRAERADVKVEYSTIDPAELLHTIVPEYKQDALDKGLELSGTAAKGVKKIRTSELYLREILQNFITNSLKYTKKGTVLVHVRSNVAGDAVFSVTDTGIGLSKSDQKHIFEKFFRSEDFRTRESSGTGLGLYVTAKLAHKIGAEITVESKLNKGSTFTIRVPSTQKKS